MFRKRMEELQEGERGNIDWAAMPPCSTLTHIPICNTSRSSLGPVSPPEEAGGEEELVRSTSMCVTGIFHPKISTQIYHFCGQDQRSFLNKQNDSGEDSTNQARGSLDSFSFQMCRWAGPQVESLVPGPDSAGQILWQEYSLNKEHEVSSEVRHVTLVTIWGLDPVKP